MKTTTEVNVEQCYHGCPFFTVEGQEHMMYCNHPYWKDKEPYAGAIINQGNCHGTVPAACPLRRESIVETKRVRLKGFKPM